MRRIAGLVAPMLALMLSAQAPLSEQAVNEDRAPAAERPAAKPWADWALRLAPVGAALLIGAVVVASRRRRP